jgi:hypothetical protein
MTDKEAMKLALFALEQMKAKANFECWNLDICDEAITALKERLAQPEQHQDWCASLTQMLMSMPPKPAPCNCKPPQRTEPPQKKKVLTFWDLSGGDITDAIKAKIKEKNQ